MVKVTYNPFRAPSFHAYREERPIFTAAIVHFKDRYCYVPSL